MDKTETAVHADCAFGRFEVRCNSRESGPLLCRATRVAVNHECPLANCGPSQPDFAGSNSKSLQISNVSPDIVVIENCDLNDFRSIVEQGH